MDIAIKKWINPNLRKSIISERKLNTLARKEKISAIYDVRAFADSSKVKETFYKTIDPVLLRNYIQVHDKKEVVIIVSEFERTHVPTLTWAKLNGYKNVLVYKAGKDEFKLTF